MGRGVNRALIKGLYKKHKQELGDFGVNVETLKSKIVSKEAFCSFMFTHKNTTYTLAPLFALLKSLSDCESGVTYLDAFLVHEYKDCMLGLTDKPLDMDMISDVIANVGTGDIGKMSSVYLTSMYILYDKLGDEFREYIEALGGDMFLAHKNIIGLSVMLNYGSINSEKYFDKALEDFLCLYEDTSRKLATVDTLARDIGVFRDVLHFIYLALKFYIELNSEGGASFDLVDIINDEYPSYLNLLEYISLDYMRDLDCEYIHKVTEAISNDTEYVLRSVINTMHLSIEIGVARLQKDREGIIKEVKGNSIKEIKALEKENKALTKELNTVTKNLKKLEKYIEKKKNSNELAEYKKKIEELELKNKQLESKLEGANLRIETLEGRITTLKDEFVKSDVAITVDKEYVVIPEVEEISLDDMLNALKGLNIVIVGGTDVSYKRISNYLPNVRYIDAENTANFDIPLNTDYVVLCTKILSHSHTRRAEVFKHSVRGILKINKTNPEEIIKDIYAAII